MERKTLIPLRRKSGMSVDVQGRKSHSFIQCLGSLSPFHQIFIPVRMIYDIPLVFRFDPSVTDPVKVTTP